MSSRCVSGAEQEGGRDSVWVIYWVLIHDIHDLMDHHLDDSSIDRSKAC